MNAQTQKRVVAGAAGDIVCAVDLPSEPAKGVAVICHPHPQHGGTLDNKVVQTLARAHVQAGLASVRFNFRGVGGSQGAWDDGRGEVEDALAVIAQAHTLAGVAAELPLRLAGFSFGAYVAAEAVHRLGTPSPVRGLMLVGPSTQKQVMQAVAAGTLVIHGEADEVVPLSATLDWARPQTLPVVVFPGVGHFFHGQLPLLKSVALSHLERPAQA
jgi:uncharacterized protein